jgi:hypothetical protein
MFFDGLALNTHHYFAIVSARICDAAFVANVTG